jgi:YD repeat-containing protein
VVKSNQWLPVVVMTLALAACGSEQESASGEPAATTEQTSQPQATPSANAPAEQVAKEARGDVSCPATVATPERAADAPVDDVVGVRPGMTYDEAANVVLCSNDLMVVTGPITSGFNIQTYGQTVRQGFTARFAEPRVEKTGEQIMQEMQDDMIARSGNAVRYDLAPGQAKWNVTTMGLPGEEKVIGAGREEWFAEGKNPTVTSVYDALIGKYGTPSIDQDNPGQRFIRWVYDPFGRLATETSPIRTQCAGTGASGGVSLSGDCGLVVEAHIVPLPDNPGLARSMEVGVVHQADGYELVTSVEQALEQQEQQQRAQAVEDAAQNADAPTL